MKNGGNVDTAGGARERKISKRWQETRGGVKLDRRAAKERERSCCSAAFGAVTG